MRLRPLQPTFSLKSRSSSASHRRSIVLEKVRPKTVLDLLTLLHFGLTFINSEMVELWTFSTEELQESSKRPKRQRRRPISDVT
ncbi:hypothetical protein PHSY_003909 [Pseudozyma hubeiensis SY62]|uniref:Uncharacterized protein n=1 Tax=Pseudozyma hubeiensis (strain SY62) TaxID=1305764 RepID=R9P4W5_PSEHS|nr:hypothetical protein PHSY_003909 [Pseudozyma hubeiensis SY62]GAC96329.1 hypothetical protein PHSY_003909 [Pseudozyma hubeiensis SY62]